MSISSLSRKILLSASTSHVRAAPLVPLGRNEMISEATSILQVVVQAHGAAILGDALKGVCVEYSLVGMAAHDSHRLRQRAQYDLHVIVVVIHLNKSKRKAS